MKQRFWIIVLVVVLLSGCASIASKSSYDVQLSSHPEGAAVTVVDKMGMTVYEGVTPSTVKLKASNGFFEGAKYTITYKKEGFNDFTTTINASVDGWYFGNIFIGGVLGMVIIDPATGAMWKLDPACCGELQDNTNSMNTSDVELKVAYLDSLTPELQEQLISKN